jgi:hypothetical protein
MLFDNSGTTPRLIASGDPSAPEASRTCVEGTVEATVDEQLSRWTAYVRADGKIVNLSKLKPKHQSAPKLVRKKRSRFCL